MSCLICVLETEPFSNLAVTSEPHLFPLETLLPVELEKPTSMGPPSAGCAALGTVVVSCFPFLPVYLDSVVVMVFETSFSNAANRLQLLLIANRVKGFCLFLKCNKA